METFLLDGRPVSRLGYGGYGIGGAYGPRDPSIWEQLIRQAFSLGITLFDTADIYGSAEEVLGRAVAPFRDQVTLATKVGAAESGARDASPRHVRRSCEASLRRLATDRVDLYQIHFDDPATPVADTIAALEDLRAEGKVRSWGVGHLPADRFREYVRLGRPATALFELSPVARQARRELLPACLEAGLRGIAFSPTGRGLLTGEINPGHRFAEGDIRSLDPLFQRGRFASGLRVRDRLAALGQAAGMSPAQMAIAWTLAQPGVSAVLTGPSRLEHLVENVGGAGWSLSDEVQSEIESWLAEEDRLIRESDLEAARGILGRPLPRDGADAFRDLLYAVETAVEHGLVTEESVLPWAGRLFGLRRERGGTYDPVLEDLREELGRLIGESGKPPAGGGRPAPDGGGRHPTPRPSGEG